MLSDPDPSVRFAAARQLAALGDARAVPALRQAVQTDGGDAVQAYAPAATRRARSAHLRCRGDAEPRFECSIASPCWSRSPLFPASWRCRFCSWQRTIPIRSCVALCAEVTADQTSPKDALARQDILKLLGGDRDAGVQARAAVLLSRLQSTIGVVPSATSAACRVGLPTPSKGEAAATGRRRQPSVAAKSPADADESDDEDEPETADEKQGRWC